MSENIQGEIVPEEEVATDLGFKDAYELRRWQTDCGNKVIELEHALRQAKDEAKGFRWVGMRQQKVLEKCDYFLASLEACGDDSLGKLRLAIAVVTGKGVDWDHVLKDWNLDGGTE